MKIKIEFDTDNAAFDPFDEEGFEISAYEINAILTTVVEQIGRGYTESVVRDSNGNTIGAWSWK